MKTYEIFHCGAGFDEDGKWHSGDPTEVGAWLLVSAVHTSANEAWTAALEYQRLYGGEVLVEEVRRKTVRHSAQS